VSLQLILHAIFRSRVGRQTNKQCVMDEQIGGSEEEKVINEGIGESEMKPK